MDREIGPDPFAALKDGSEEYHVYDKHYERIGRVDDVFIDDRDVVSYVGVKMGFFGTNSTLVPVEILRVNDIRRLVEVDADAETIKHAPHFGHDETVSPDLEDRVRTYFGLEPLMPPKPAETYPPEDATRFGPDARVDTEPGERGKTRTSSPVRRSEIPSPANPSTPYPPTAGTARPARAASSTTAGDCRDTGFAPAGTYRAPHRTRVEPKAGTGLLSGLGLRLVCLPWPALQGRSSVLIARRSSIAR